MNFKLKLDIPGAEQEAIWLNDYINEHDIDGLETKVLETSPEKGTMDGGIFTGLLGLVVAETVKKVISSLIDILFKQFDGKRAEFELTGECPDSGKKFTLKFNNASETKRDKIQREFERRYMDICNEQIS